MTKPVYENKYFRIEHSSHYRIAGFLFVIAKEDVNSIPELSTPALECMGATLSLAIEAVESVINPINIYCTKFGESGQGLHFHIFPRTQSLTTEYRSQTGFGTEIDGPHLMSWANQYFTGGRQHGNVQETVQQFSEYFDNGA